MASGGAAEAESERRKTGQGARERRTTWRFGRSAREGRLRRRAGVEEEKAGLVRRSARRRTRSVAEASLMRSRSSDRSHGVDWVREPKSKRSEWDCTQSTVIISGYGLGREARSVACLPVEEAPERKRAGEEGVDRC